MQATVDIQFDELLKIVKNLPGSKLSILKAEIEKQTTSANKRSDFEALLLGGPTFSEEQIEEIARTRTAINKWRTK
ncbi:MAG: hypothetical protein M3O71_18880 [Bacteroidota bacterium]|nr:hypothetical protein [Bacteroidota bacterium]